MGVLINIISFENTCDHGVSRLNDARGIHVTTRNRIEYRSLLIQIERVKVSNELNRQDLKVHRLKYPVVLH